MSKNSGLFDSDFLTNLGMFLDAVSAFDDEEDMSWQEDYVDMLDTSLSPYDYDSEDEYLWALEEEKEEKYGWRDEYRYEDIDPDEYETEEEFLLCLEQERYGWRDDYTNEVIDPDDYETEGEFLEALENCVQEFEDDEGIEPDVDEDTVIELDTDGTYYTITDEDADGKYYIIIDEDDGYN